MKPKKFVLALLALTFALALQSPKTTFAQAYQKEIQRQIDFADAGEV